MARNSNERPEAPEQMYDATYGATISAMDAALRSSGFKLAATSMSAGHFLARETATGRSVIVILKRVSRETTAVRIAIDGARKDVRLQRLAKDILLSIETNLNSRNAL